MVDLVDHGGGDGGGLETHTGAVMSNRGVDGIVANQCLMNTMGFAEALSRAGVKFLAASLER